MTQVIFSESNFTRLDDDAIEELLELAKRSPRGRARFCLHRNHDDALQEMIIALSKNAYIPPHRQLDKHKSYISLEGEIAVYFFDDHGTVREKLRMSPRNQSGQTVIRFPADQWHTVTSLTPASLYMELIPGPYVPEKTYYADWAPAEAEHERASEYLSSLQSIEDIP